jgi:hypothetical protein
MTSRTVLRIVLTIVAALIVLAVLFGVLTFVNDRGSSESPAGAIPSASPPPTVSQ